ncbi:MAG: hypothetical protein ACI4TD_09520 [Phocaeicola sp.]
MLKITKIVTTNITAKSGRLLPKAIEHFVTFTILAIFAMYVLYVILFSPLSGMLFALI